MSIFQERRILEETVTHLTPTGLACQQLGQTAVVPSALGNNETGTGSAPLQVNGHKTATENEDQHASKLHFFLGTVNTHRNIIQTCSPEKCDKCGLFLFSFSNDRLCLRCETFKETGTVEDGFPGSEPSYK